MVGLPIIHIFCNSISHTLIHLFPTPTKTYIESVSEISSNHEAPTLHLRRLLPRNQCIRILSPNYFNQFPLHPTTPMLLTTVIHRRIHPPIRGDTRTIPLLPRIRDRNPPRISIPTGHQGGHVGQGIFGLASRGLLVSFQRWE